MAYRVDSAPASVSAAPEPGAARDDAGASHRTLIDIFDGFAGLSDEFVIHDDGYRTRSYQYRQIARAAGAFAERLRGESVHKGERVLLWSESRPQWLVAFWGCVLEGVVVVPVDYRASPEVVRRIQEVVHARLILVGDDVAVSSTGADLPVIWRLADLDMAAAPVSPRVAQISPDDPAEFVFTSGSTAAPKGVVITHRNIAADLLPIEREVLHYRKYVRPAFPLRFLNLLPLSHMFGQALATFFPPMLPGAVVMVHSYNPQEIARQIRKRRVSFLVSVPKMLDILRQYVVRLAPKTAHPSGGESHWLLLWWRYRKVHRHFGLKFWGFVVGGAPLEAELEEFWSRLGFLVVQGYGLTETAPVISFNHPFHSRRGSVGTPLTGVEVKIAPDGEILVRGDIVTPGYLNAPAENASAFEGGWFHTGDIGKLDDQHYLYVRGRKSEVIVTPEGLKVFPDDVELVLAQMPDVTDAAVVGRGRVHAVLVLKPGADKEEVVRLANAQLSDHQKIRSVSVWTGGKLPRTAGTGKLRRHAIQQWVDAGGPPPPALSLDDQITTLIKNYAPDRTITPETTLQEIGLSSLERVELMVELEQSFNVAIDEARFTEATTVADLSRQVSLPAASAAPREPIEFINWNRSALAGLVRRAALAGLFLPLTRLCVRMHVTGLEELKFLEGPVVFAANHQSHLDTAAIFAALPARWRYSIAPAMLKEFFDAHFYPSQYSRMRWLSNSLTYYLATLFFNGFPIPQHEAGIRQTLRHIGDLASEGWSILIYPEGERTESGEIKPFQLGVALIAARLRVPVVPVHLRGLDRVLHRGSRMIYPGPVSVSFGKPLNLRGENYEALADQVRKAVCAL